MYKQINVRAVSGTRKKKTFKAYFSVFSLFFFAFSSVFLLFVFFFWFLFDFLFFSFFFFGEREEGEEGGGQRDASVSVNRDTDQSFPVCTVNLATLKVAKLQVSGRNRGVFFNDVGRSRVLQNIVTKTALQKRMCVGTVQTPKTIKEAMKKPEAEAAVDTETWQKT